MYYVVYGISYGLSLLPMWFLYGMSDAMSLLLYYVIRYRRGVVDSNLLIAFPEKPEADRRRIAKKFYRNFTDNFIETLKLLSASPSFIRERFIIDNPEVFYEFYTSGRKLHLHMGHTFNWEVANVAMPLLTPYTFIVTYMPIENKVFERLFLRLRRMNGTVLLPATRMRQAIIPYRHTQYILALVADQAPGGPDHSYWLNFFGRPTPFVRSPERGARIADIPAVFAQIYKTKRGHYRSKLTIISDHPAALPEGELTRRYRDILEATIRDQPEVWLWSHKRWKIPFKDEYQKLWID
jgi:KDO2-lipid IV(A) lauroyltransferase